MTAFINWIKATAGSITTEVQKFNNQSFLEAVVAGCTMVAASDGVIKPEEKRKMMGYMQISDALKCFEMSKVIDLFEKFAKNYEFDEQIGKDACLSVIKKFAEQEEASTIVRVCCAIGASDGTFDDDEKNAVREICRALNLSPANFNL